MPRLSSRSKELIHELRFKVLSKDRRLQLLHELAATRQINAAPHFLVEYLDHDLPADAIALLLEPLALRMTTTALLGWSEQAADGPGYKLDWKPTWEKLAAFAKVQGGWAAFAFASLFGNGYIREQAVRKLATQQDGRETLFLIFRSVDHISPVRQAAATALHSRFNVASAGPFVAALPLMRMLERRQRNDPNLFAWVLQFLSLPVGWPALRIGLESNDREVRRECFDLALTLRRDEVQALALRDPDPVIRMKVVRGLQASAAKLAIADPNPSVRATAYEKLAGLDDLTERNFWMGALLDSSSTIRMMARLWLSKHSQVDVAAVYRSAVAAGDHLVPAIAGLAESCPPEDAAELLFIANANARVREQLVSALSKMLRAEAADVLLPMLSDQSSRVALKAQRALQRYSVPSVAETVWTLLPSAPRKRVLPLLRLLLVLPSRWVSLDYLLRATTLPEPIAGQAAWLLGKWRSAPRPLRREDAIALRDRIRSVPAGLLPDRVAANLHSSLDYWVRANE
jgi:HEAT repeat protein